MKISNIFQSVTFLLMFTACSSEKTTPETELPLNMTADSVKKPSFYVPDFSSDTAYNYIEKQVGFGPRVPGTLAHEKCKNYLVSELKRFGADVTVQQAPAVTFDGHRIILKNIIAEFEPEKQNRVLLFAHWDTRPFADQDNKDRYKPIDGANDGGSGVGVLLEMARLMAAKRPNVGVDIIFFDAEDWGDTSHFGGVADSYCLGSQYWAKNMHKPNYAPKYGILLDMVGGKDAMFVWEEHSVKSANSLLQKVWLTADDLGYGKFFRNYTRTGVIDDHYYIMKSTSIPVIDIINFNLEAGFSFGTTWHKHSDNMENISKETLKAVGQTVLTVVYSEK